MKSKRKVLKMHFFGHIMPHHALLDTSKVSLLAHLSLFRHI